MVPARTFLTGLALAAAVTVAPGIRAQSPAPDATALVERAGRYVEAYIDAFSAVVSEEHQVQKLVRPDGRVRKSRELKSDFLLVKTGTGPWPLVFRDVIAADGKPVRDRSDRLRKLFLEQPKAAVELARAIAKESERLNIGLHRTGNSPLLPLIFLTPRVAPGVRYAIDGSRLTFEELRSPSVLARRSPDGRHDIMSKGWFEIDPDTGNVLAADFTGHDSPDHNSISPRVRYQKDTRLNLSVPVEASERYRKPGTLPNPPRLPNLA
jgi:hypothetical protein